MPTDQPIGDRMYLDNPAARHEQRTRDLLYLLTKPDDPQPLWSVEDAGREMRIEEPVLHVVDLITAGLAYQTADGFVFASRAGYRAVQVIGQVV
jgi:hypothetical protein